MNGLNTLPQNPHDNFRQVLNSDCISRTNVVDLIRGTRALHDFNDGSDYIINMNEIPKLLPSSIYHRRLVPSQSLKELRDHAAVVVVTVASSMYIEEAHRDSLKT